LVTSFFLASHSAEAIFQWGMIQYEASTLWVRDRKALNEALDITPPFLRTPQGDAGTIHSFDDFFPTITLTVCLKELPRISATGI
jgi:hypothetical protein